MPYHPNYFSTTRFRSDGFQPPVTTPTPKIRMPRSVSTAIENSHSQLKMVLDVSSFASHFPFSKNHRLFADVDPPEESRRRKKASYSTTSLVCNLPQLPYLLHLDSIATAQQPVRAAPLSPKLRATGTSAAGDHRHRPPRRSGRSLHPAVLIRPPI